MTTGTENETTPPLPTLRERLKALVAEEEEQMRAEGYTEKGVRSFGDVSLRGLRKILAETAEETPTTKIYLIEVYNPDDDEWDISRFRRVAYLSREGAEAERVRFAAEVSYYEEDDLRVVEFEVHP